MKTFLYVAAVLGGAMLAHVQAQAMDYGKILKPFRPSNPLVECRRLPPVPPVVTPGEEVYPVHAGRASAVQHVAVAPNNDAPYLICGGAVVVGLVLGALVYTKSKD